MLDTKALAEATALIVREHVAAAIAPLLERIGVLEAEKAALPDFDAMLSKAVSSIELPEAPAPLAPDMEEVGKMIARAVDSAVTARPAPKDGTSFTAEDARPIVESLVKDAVDGIAAPKDGVGLAGALIDRDGALVVTLTDGTARSLGPVVGKDVDMVAVKDAIASSVAALPKPKDGVDALGFDDLTVEHDGERSFVLRFVQGDRSKEFAFDIPVVLDRGVWREGEYKAGDAVTWAGSLWIAQKDTDAKPDSGEGWRLSVKRGRDGKDKV